MHVLCSAVCYRACRRRDPNQYLKFSDHRVRPALDLIAQIPLEAPRAIYDLGCGPGNITRLLAERWPGAMVTGVDSSPDMLAKARREAPGVAFQLADLAHWSPPAPADLLFSNATLHWLDDHAALLPRLITQLAPGGVLAVQIPRNHQSPSHTLIDVAAADGPWRARLARVRAVYGSVLAPDEYYRILAPIVRRVDIWESESMHPLEGDRERRLCHWLNAEITMQERDFGHAVAEAELARNLAPYDAFMVGDLSSVLMASGEPIRAIEWTEFATSRDPSNAAYYNGLKGWALEIAGRPKDSLAALSNAQIYGGMEHLLKAIDLVRLGRDDEAKVELMNGLAEYPAMTLATWRQINAYSDPRILEEEVTDLAKAGMPQR
jgi:trans-aconitate 2-methyltransferase